MKFFVISDNTDTLMGLRLAGIEGVVAHGRDEVLTLLNEVIQMEDVAIVLMTTLCIQTCADVVAELKLKLQRPLIVEIPDRHGSADMSKAIDAYISEVIGIKI